MKTILAVAMLLSAHAFAADSGTITCKTKTVTGNTFPVEITLDAKVARVEAANQDPKAEQIALHDVTMTIKGLDKGDEMESGHAAQIVGKINPRARKYKEFYTTVMDGLKDVNTLKQFAPYQDCFFNVYLPTNMWSKSRFDVPVVTQCEQTGGTQGLECDLN